MTTASLACDGVMNKCRWFEMSDLVKEHCFSAGAVFDHVSNTMVLPQDFGFFLKD